jgi:hypothetical protein
LDDKAIAALLSPGEGETPAALTVAADDPSPPNLRQSSGGGGSGGYSALFPGGPGPLIGPPPTPPISPVAPVIPPAAVPEPASWVMMIAGFSGVGALHRRRNRHRGRAARLAGGAVAVAELLGATGLASARTAALASHKASTAIGTSLASAVAKKAAVCVCSGAILTAAVTTVPPLKRAVHAATMPARALSHENCKPA